MQQTIILKCGPFIPYGCIGAFTNGPEVTICIKSTRHSGDTGFLHGFCRFLLSQADHMYSVFTPFSNDNSSDADDRTNAIDHEWLLYRSFYYFKECCPWDANAHVKIWLECNPSFAGSGLPRETVAGTRSPPGLHIVHGRAVRCVLASLCFRSRRSVFIGRI